MTKNVSGVRCRGGKSARGLAHSGTLHAKYEKSSFIERDRVFIVFRIVPNFLRYRTLSCFIVAKIRNPFFKVRELPGLGEQNGNFCQTSQDLAYALIRAKKTFFPLAEKKKDIGVKSQLAARCRPPRHARTRDATPIDNCFVTPVWMLKRLEGRAQGAVSRCARVIPTNSNQLKGVTRYVNDDKIFILNRLVPDNGRAKDVQASCPPSTNVRRRLADFICTPALTVLSLGIVRSIHQR